MPGFVLLVRPRGDDDAVPAVGFTVSKKVGGAVTRNRMKRRLRELARAALPDSGIAGAAHVLIGRAGGNDIAFADRSAERRGGKACVRRCKTRRSPYHNKKHHT